MTGRPLVHFAAFAILLSLSIVFGWFPRSVNAAEVDYAENVAPILEKYCTGCHNEDESKGELNLESFEALAQGGESGPAVVPGKSAESLLFQLVTRTKRPYMPPGKRKRPTTEEIAALKTWIDSGASAPVSVARRSGQSEIPQVALTAPVRHPVTALAYSPDGDTVALGRYGEIELYSSHRRQTVRLVSGVDGKVLALAFTKSGQGLVSAGGHPGSAGNATLWRVAEETEATDRPQVRRFDGHKDNVFSLAVSPDDRTLATGSYDGEVRLWNVDSGELLHSISAHNAAVFSLSFRADGRVFASASGDRTVKLWQTDTAERLDTFTEATKGVYALDFSPDGRRLASAGVESRIRVWSISESAKNGTNQILYSRFGHDGPIIRLDYSPDGDTLLSSAEDRTVKLWNASKITERVLLPPQPDWAPATAFRPDSGQLAVGRLDGTLEFFDVGTGLPLRISRSPNSVSSQTTGYAMYAAALGALALGAPEKAPTTDEAPKPKLTGLKPRGVRRGTTTRVKLTGEDLNEIKEIKVHHSGLSARLASRQNQAPDKSPSERWIELTVSSELSPGTHELSVITAGGESERQKLFVGDLPHIYEEKSDADSEFVQQIDAEVDSGWSVWGRLDVPGDQDVFEFTGEVGTTIILDGEAKRLGSEADLIVTLLDHQGRVIVSNNDFTTDRDPLVVHTLAQSASYRVRVADLTRRGSEKHYYRLNVGAFPFVTACYPLSVPANRKTSVELIGYNLNSDSTTLQAGDPGEQAVEIDRERFRTRAPIQVIVDDAVQVLEREPNNRTENATKMVVPSIAHGRSHAGEESHAPDVDLFRFQAQAGRTLVIETEAARRGSPMDTKIEVLTTTGELVPRVLLQAVRDSVITFRPINSRSRGARLEYWQEMRVNQFLYINREVCKLFRAPRGPDSQWDFYQREGSRRNYFGTSATAHPLFQPSYIVEAHPPGSKLIPNGLPMFEVGYVNDDDSDRKLGRDSRLLFTPPTNGEYLVRVTNVTGTSDPHQLYQLRVREAAPDFTVRLLNHSVTVPRGDGVSFTVRADRRDGYEGEIRVKITGIPAGLIISNPLVIEAGHTEAKGTIYSAPNAPQPSTDAIAAIDLSAQAEVSGETLIKNVKGFESIDLADPPPFFVSLEEFVSDDERRQTAEWLPLDPAGALSDGGAQLTVIDKGAILVSGIRSETDLYTVKVNTAAHWIQGLRLELRGHPSLPNGGAGRGKDGAFALTGLQVRAAPLGRPAESRDVRLVNPKLLAEDAPDDATEGLKALLDDESDTVWSTAATAEKPTTASFEFESPIHNPLGTTLTVTLSQDAGEQQTLGHFRLLALAVPATVRKENPVELTIAPGETISAMIRVERNGHDDRIGLQVDNLPHGVIVDNIGLNGVLVRPGEVEREIFLTCDAGVKKQTRLCYLISKDPGGHASRPVVLHVKKRKEIAATK